MSKRLNRLTRDGQVSQAYQIVRAIDDGCRSSLEISDETGLPHHTVSAYLSRLRADGYIRLTGLAQAGRGIRGEYELACQRRERTA